MDLTRGASGWLVRHARPCLEPGVCYGRTEVEADAAHTQAVALALHAHLAPDAVVWCSPRLRCRVLAQALCALRPGLAWREDERLAEMDFGCWEGVRWDRIDRAALDRWQADFAGERFGGRESVRELMRRVASAWDEARALDGPWAWITHAGVMRAAMLLASGRRSVGASADWPGLRLDFGEALVLEGDRLAPAGLSR